MTVSDSAAYIEWICMFLLCVCSSSSFNDLQHGLVADSFAGSIINELHLSSCNLRASSLVSGLFSSSIAILYLDNLQRDALPLPFQQLSATARLFSASFFNPPGQPYAFRGPTVQEYLNSWSNLFDPCQSSLSLIHFRSAIRGKLKIPCLLSSCYLSGTVPTPVLPANVNLQVYLGGTCSVPVRLFSEP
jgi:hypothetical protein